MRLPWVLLLGLSATLMACGPADVEPDTPPRAEEEGPNECGVDDYSSLVGQPINSFDQSTALGPVRVIPPGSIIINDYNPKRLNVDLNNRDVIVRFWCG